jgi:hypothetical protein
VTRRRKATYTDNGNEDKTGRKAWVLTGGGGQRAGVRRRRRRRRRRRKGRRRRDTVSCFNISAYTCCHHLSTSEQDCGGGLIHRFDSDIKEWATGAWRCAMEWGLVVMRKV